MGQTAYVDGPYGSLHLPNTRSPSILMVGGGIGISPLLSMLRTLRDTGQSARLVLIYAAERAEDLVCNTELDDLEQELDLEVVRVLREPPENWPGRRGIVDADLIESYLATDPSKWDVVLCGPPPMMDAVEQAVRDQGVPLRQIHSERFDIGAAHAVGRRSAEIRGLVLALGAVMLGAAALFAW